MDRGIKLAERTHPQTDIRQWRSSRKEIRRAILTEGYSEEVGAFTQAFGETQLDASALVIPLTGFLPVTDYRVQSTIAKVRERLTSNGLVYRYLTSDGLPGSAATFVLCSFWLVDNLAMEGRAGEARELFERITAYANDLGLLAEEIDPVSGEFLGNYPQGFSHLALIRLALNIARCEAEGREERVETTVERAQVTERSGRKTEALKE